MIHQPEPNESWTSPKLFSNPNQMNRYHHNDRKRDTESETERVSGEEVRGLSWTADCSLNVIQAGSRSTTVFPHHTGGEEKQRTTSSERRREEKK